MSFAFWMIFFGWELYRVVELLGGGSVTVMSETSFLLIEIETETFENLVLISRLVSRLLKI